MNLNQLKEDEGIRYEVYLDHLGYPTFGIGHLILKSDPEYGLPIGSKVSSQRVEQAFEADVARTIKDCTILYRNWDTYPIEVQEILVNMMFNLGRTRLSKFVKMNAAIEKHDWVEASKQGRDSRWAQQVPNRARRLMDKLCSLKSPQKT